MEIKKHSLLRTIFSSILVYFLFLGLLTSQSGCAYFHMTPLGSAAREGDLDAVSALLQNDVDLNEQSMGFGDPAPLRSPLQWATLKCHSDIVRMLLDSGADVSTNCEGWAAIHDAVLCGDPEMVKLLLDNGADINAVAWLRWTPLSMAIEKGNTSVVKVLLDRGASINAKDLQKAQEKSYTTIVQMLQRAEQDRYGVSIGSVPGLTAKDQELVEKPATKLEKKPLTTASVPAIYISTYDTIDPLEIGHETIYVIEAQNEGTGACTNLQLENVVPEQMVFVSATPNPLEVRGNTVVFPKVKIIQPGDKLIYKVVCKGIKNGSAKNVAVIKYTEFYKPLTDEEGTSVYGSATMSSTAEEIKEFPKDANSGIRQTAAGVKVEDKAKEQPKETSVTYRESQRLTRIKKSLDENLPKLRSSDPEERAKAASDLGSDGAESALPELAKLLKDPHPEPRSRAIGAIGDLGGQAYVDEIAALLCDSDTGVKQYAVGALVDLDAKRYASAIASLLNDHTWETRGVALYALGDLGASQFTQQVAKHLKARRCGEVAGAIVTLSKFGARQYGDRIISIVRRYPDCGSTLLQAFGYLGDRSYVADLVRYLRTGKNDSIKARAALALAYLNAKSYEDEIAGLLNGREYSAGDAALALGILGSKKYSAAVAKLAVGKYRCNSKATQALGMMGAKAQADVVAAILRKGDYFAVGAAIWTLGRLKASKHAGIVAAFLEYKGSCWIYDLDTHRSKKERVDKLAKEALLRMGLDPVKVEVEDPMSRSRSRYTRRPSS
jgi:uncharacterized repeat protein (TIGR01451 family)